MADPKPPGRDHQLEFHLATAEDFEGVMAISGDVYRGMDYLPVKYHSWLQETNRRTFVAKRKGQVVALESVCLVDSGSTAVTEGLRVAPWERGRGLPRLILEHIEEFLKAEFPAVKVIRLTRMQDPPSSMLHKYRLLHSRVALDSICLVDGGSTAVTEGLRVAPWERGRGITRLMLDHVQDFLKSEFPAVKVIRLTRMQDPPPGMLLKYRLLHSKAVLSVIFKAEEVQEKVHVLISRMEKEGQCFQPPVTLEAKDVMRVCTNQTVIDKLLPAKMLIQNWLPVFPTKPNLEYLLTKGITWMVDNPEEPNVLSLGTPAIRVPLEGGCHKIDVDLFGIDTRNVKMHFLAQLMAISKEIDKGLLVCFLLMEKALFPTIDAFCEDLNRFVVATEQLVMEKDI